MRSGGTRAAAASVRSFEDPVVRRYPCCGRGRGEGHVTASLGPASLGVAANPIRVGRSAIVDIASAIDVEGYSRARLPARYLCSDAVEVARAQGWRIAVKGGRAPMCVGAVMLRMRTSSRMEWFVPLVSRTRAVGRNRERGFAFVDYRRQGQTMNAPRHRCLLSSPPQRRLYHVGTACNVSTLAWPKSIALCGVDAAWMTSKAHAYADCAPST